MVCGRCRRGRADARRRRRRGRRRRARRLGLPGHVRAGGARRGARRASKRPGSRSSRSSSRCLPKTSVTVDDEGAARKIVRLIEALEDTRRRAGRLRELRHPRGRARSVAAGAGLRSDCGGGPTAGLTANRIESLLSARLFLNPQLAGDRLYFVSDLSGRLSLYVDGRRRQRAGAAPSAAASRSRTRSSSAAISSTSCPSTTGSCSCSTRTATRTTSRT